MDAGRPTAVLVMAEYWVGDPVWDRPDGSGDPLDLAALGVSAQLVQRLRDWNHRYEDKDAVTFEWRSRAAEAAWREEGRDLAYELQDELPDVDVRYFEDGDDRPIRERRSR